MVGMRPVAAQGKEWAEHGKLLDNGVIWLSEKPTKKTSDFLVSQQAFLGVREGLWLLHGEKETVMPLHPKDFFPGKISTSYAASTGSSRGHFNAEASRELLRTSMAGVSKLTPGLQKEYMGHREDLVQAHIVPSTRSKEAFERLILRSEGIEPGEPTLYAQLQIDGACNGVLLTPLIHDRFDGRVSCGFVAGSHSHSCRALRQAPHAAVCRLACYPALAIMAARSSSASPEESDAAEAGQIATGRSLLEQLREWLAGMPADAHFLELVPMANEWKRLDRDFATSTRRCGLSLDGGFLPTHGPRHQRVSVQESTCLGGRKRADSIYKKDDAAVLWQPRSNGERKRLRRSRHLRASTGDDTPTHRVVHWQELRRMSAHWYHRHPD